MSMKISYDFTNALYDDRRYIIWKYQKLEPRSAKGNIQGLWSVRRIGSLARDSAYV